MLEPTRTGRSPRLIRGPFELTRDAMLALHATNPQRYPVLLESAAASTALGRHDVLFALPGERLVLEADGTLRAPSTLPAGGGYFLERLDAWWQQDRIGCDPNVVPAGLPFAGGWF
ncbi:MAG TPA: hypothetical protein VLT59_10525, partial [Steroidobacteraceae bacterium]|nr:hypothetical protein [Steroidobacteraceae bacterium]